MALVPSEISLLQTYSVNKLLENFSYDLIFPMDLHGESGPRSDSEKRGKLQPLRTSIDEFSQFEDSSSTPSSVQSDYFSYSGSTKNNQPCSPNNWYSSRPNIASQAETNFLENSVLFSPPKRYLSDSNLTNYQFGSGDTSPVENSTFSNSSYSSPLKNEFNGNNHSNSSKGPMEQRQAGIPDYEPYHTRSSFNLNYSTSSPVQKMDKGAMYSSDLLNNLLAFNSSSNSPDTFAANMKELEHTMRILQSHQQTSGNYLEKSRGHHQQPNNFQRRQNSCYGSSSFSRQNSSSGDETMDFRQSSYSSLGKQTHKFKHSVTASNSASNFSSCSSLDLNSHSSGSGGAAGGCSSLPANSVRTWNGIIPTRTSKAVTYSQKIFLGGIPWETSEETLKQIFGRFGPLRVEWPGKDPNFSTKPKGCVYIIFENEKQVRDLLAACQLIGGRNASMDDGKYFYKFPWKNLKTKNVEVIPWNIADSNYVSSSQILDPSKTIFVGALHGKLTAEGLALIMNDLFDGVVYAGIDTDKHKYPLGAGRVTFNNPQSYMKAIQTGYLLIKTPIFTKKVQIDPYLEDNLCSSCNIHHGPYYCRELSCFRYFCRVCWQLQHNDALRSHHRPLTRNSKVQSIVFND